MDDPVILSGGDLGGQVIEGQGWVVGDERLVAGLLYRRGDDGVATYCGPAQ